MARIVWIEDQVEIGENSEIQITGVLSAEAGRTEGPAETAENTVNILRILYDQVFFWAVMNIINRRESQDFLCACRRMQDHLFTFSKNHNHSRDPMYN